MKLLIEGQQIKLTKTLIEDIDEIIENERNNNNFVYEYSKEKHLEIINSENNYHISIRRIDNNDFVGHMILLGLDNPNQVLEFRRIAIKEKGMGFGREAIQLVKKLCFEQLKFHRLWLDVFADNLVAINLYETEGFIYEGTLRENVKTEYGYRSQRIYSILDKEYISQNKQI